MEEDADRKQAAGKDPHEPEEDGVDAAVEEVEGDQIIVFGAVELGQKVDEYQEQDCDDIGPE